MAKPKLGNTVRVHYTGTLDDGSVFDSSVEREPLEFTIGECKLIPGFEKAVLDLNPGEWKTTRLSADEAYGPYRDEMVIVTPRSELPEGLELEVGQIVEMTHPDNPSIVARVTDASESSVTLDGNHPLAGKDLTFEVQLIEIV